MINMIHQIDGVCFKNMVDYAVRNLNIHCKLVNQLNVFPVPDGDTGTNMVTTIHKGLLSIGETLVDLPSVSKKFAHSVVFEARGNSGVIVSQFLKGLSQHFYELEAANSKALVEALKKGVECAYASVANPVEGTMLTVIKDATEAVTSEFNPNQTVNDIINGFVKHARLSLENTPELLPVLKETGVVDSGGAGIVYLFEGMKKYLDGEDLEALAADPKSPVIDYESFNRDSSFRYGYCTEFLLQLLNKKEDFVLEDFKQKLALLGDSLVVSYQNDKVRVHIHTHYPEKVFALAHRYGEFLSSKIENMTVQHTDLTKRIMCSKSKNNGKFAIVAVAYDISMQKLFIEMGADVVIYSEDNVSTKDYLEAFDKIESKHIFVFPNSSDAILSAIQAKKLYTKSKVIVVNSRGIAECYATLPAINFEETDIEKVNDDITRIINNLFVVSVAKRQNAVRFGNKTICRNEYYSFSRKELILISKNLEETVVQTIKMVLKKYKKDIITIFYKSSVSPEQMENIEEAVNSLGVAVELFTVPTDNLPCEMSVAFE